jgi:hypothetical protein
VEIDPIHAKTLGMWLEEMEQRTREVSVEGVLKVADTLRNRFAIAGNDGQRYEGRAHPQLLAHAVIEGRYWALMRITTSTSDRTGAKIDRISLIELRRK